MKRSVLTAVLGLMCLGTLFGLVSCESLEAVTESTEAVTSTTTGQGIYLEFRFDGECFVEVREGDEDGVGVLRGHYGEGDVRRGGGRTVYWMSVDNPDALRVYINSALVTDGLAGGAGEFLITELGVERVE